jgi:hypothetical protein
VRLRPIRFWPSGEAGLTLPFSAPGLWLQGSIPR